MGRSDTKREPSLKEKGSSIGGKDKDTPSKAARGVSRSSIKEKGTLLPVTGPGRLRYANFAPVMD